MEWVPWIRTSPSKMTKLTPLHKNEEILLLHLTDTFKSPMPWIDTRALILLLMLKSVLWLLEMGVGRPDGMLTRLSLRTITLHSMKNSVLLSLPFFPFVLGCFGGIGSQAGKFLCTLAFLELRQQDVLRERTRLAPLSPSDRSQLHARCFRQASTRILAALAKSTVMRLTGAPSLPSPTYLPHRLCPSNCPGPAPPFFLSLSPPRYASSLSSLP